MKLCEAYSWGVPCFNDCQCSYFWVPTISLEPQGLIDSFLFMTHLGIVIRGCRGPFDLFVFFIIYFEDQDTPPTKKTMHVTCVYMRFNLPSFINIPQILGIFFDSLGNSPPSSPSPGKSVNLGWVGECIMCCIQWGHDPYRKKKGLTSPPQQDRIISNKGLWFAYGLIDMY